jgi:hypothetical protein
VRSIYVPLPDVAIERLREMARRELRDPKAQASYLILSGLRAAGLDPEPRSDQAPVLRERQR